MSRVRRISHEHGEFLPSFYVIDRLCFMGERFKAS